MSISHKHFTDISTFLKNETAIVLDTGKEYLVEARLALIAREEGFPSLEDLIDKVINTHDQRLRKRILLALTTNETSFFRDLAPFEALKTTILPELITKRASAKTLTVWSAACSTGQEAYSIAMLIRESFPQLSSWKVRIIGSDVNSHVVEKARSAEYSSLEVNRGLPASHLVKYFEQHGPMFRLKEEVSSLVEFHDLNLIKTWPFSSIDILFLRNVLIYFDLETKQEIFRKVRKCLSPDGYLFLGAAETPHRVDESFQRVAIKNATAYQVIKARQDYRGSETLTELRKPI
jgi:chemotaxis protein methyltransferase CheR